MAQEGGVGGKVADERRMATNAATSAGSPHRSSMVRRVGKEGQLKKCWTVWSWARHSGQADEAPYARLI